MSTRIIVERVEPAVDPLSDFVALIDIIEIKLDIGTGQPSVRERLDGVLADIRRDCPVGEEQISVLTDAVERLHWIETCLADFWKQLPEQTSS